jgi:hypothetical protein
MVPAKSTRTFMDQVVADLHPSRILATLRDTLLPKLLSREVSITEQPH